MKKTFVKTIGVVTLAALSTVSALAATTGFNQTAAGPYDYNDTANWVGSSINGIWDTSLALTAGQTVTFATPTTLSTGLTFNYGGNFALTLQASAAGTQDLTLGGDVGLNTGGGTTANVTIGNSANHLNVDLGGANRTFTVAASRTLTLVDVLSGSGFGITNAGAGTLALNGANTYDGGATLNAGAINFANNASFGTGTITANGGTIKNTAGVTTINNLVVNGATTLDVTGGNWTFNGNISGSGAINRGTGATLSFYLGGDNSGYTGTWTSPNNGNAVVRITSPNAGSAGASWVFNNATAGRTTLEWATNGGVGTISFGSLTGGGQIQNNTSGTKTISAGALGLNDTFSGILAANGANTLAFTKVGSGTMTLSGANTYTGDTTISGGALTIGSAGKLGNGFYSGAIINNGSFTYSSSAAQTLSGPISGSGNLTNSGSGALTLSGVCSFTGNLSATAGTLILSSPASFSLSTVGVSDGATLSETFSPSVQMTVSSLTLGLTTGATNAFVPNSTSVARISAGTLTLNGVNTINIIGGNLAVGSSYPLIAYTTLAGAGSYTLGALPPGVAGNLSTSANTIYFNVTGVTNTVWTGAVNGMWDINGTANWTNTGTLGNKYINGSPVQFDDNGLNTATISNSVATTVSPISVLVTNNVSNYAIKANVIIAGAASLTKTGTANLTNSTPNTYTGPTAINKGQLVVGVASVANTSGALGNNSAVTLANDSTAVLNLNNLATQIGSLSGGGASGGNVALGNATLTLGADNTSTTYSGAVSGTGGTLIKIGTGTQTFSGTNTYTAGTRVNAGTMVLSGRQTGGSFLSLNNVGAQNAVLKITSGATLALTADLNHAEATGSRGAVYQQGGALSTANIFRVAGGAGSYGYYSLSGGTVTNSAGDMLVGSGNSSIGVMDVTGGSLTTASWIVLGRNGGTASGLLNVTGGSVTSGANNISLNWGGSAGAISILNVGGGTGAASVTGVNNAGNWLDVSVANVAGQIGVVNLRSNGTLTVAKVQVGGANSTALFNFNGGTLKATTTNAGVNFMNDVDMDAVTVYSGGGTIDNNGTNITIGNALGAATGNGVTSIAVTAGGSGYIGAPLVKFTDGTGDPATGYAVMTDDLTGNGTYKVSSIVISSPGTYSVDPTAATLSGGGATTAATLGTITTAANTSGGMTFQGSGTTTLTGNLSYGGGTKVLGGTLVLSAATGLPNPGGDLVVSNATLNLDASSGTMSANNVSVGSTLNLTVSPSANAINGTGNMTVGSKTTNNFAYGTLSSAPSAAVIKVTGTLTKGTNIVFNVSATGLQPGWIVPLIEADSTAMTTNGFVLGTLPAGVKAVLTNSTANTLDLLVTSAGQLLTWHGSEDGINPAINWDINTSTNWYSLPSSAPAKYLQYLGNTIGDNVTFGDSALYTDGTNHVNLTTTVVPATVLFSSSSYPYELHGAGGIGGATSLALTNNSAAVYLNTSNSYTGGTIVSSGTLVITNNNALGATSGGLTLGGGTLQLDAPITNSRAVTVTANSTIALAANATAQLSGNFSGAGIALTVSGIAYSGATAGSAGTFNLTGSGTNTILTVGTYPGNTLLNLSTDRSANNLLVGNAGSAAVRQTGGNLTINGGAGEGLCVGNIAGAFGYYNMQGGTLTANGIAVGGENNTGSGFSGTGGDGIMEINGGTVNNFGWLVMARGVTAETGILNVFSGSLTYAGGGLQCNWGAGQTSIINIMGGSVSSTNTPVNFLNAGSTGILNLKGGLLQPSAVTGSGILNFNGGTLKPIANNNNFVNVIRANVYSGGATIDDGGYSVTINSPLLAPEGYGVSSISLSDGGSGYIAPPIVIISGGTGSNATAIATISGGSVTGITVTSPGNGYDSGDSLSLTFSGGGANVTQPTVSAVNLAPNTSGGLTKLGSGTLTLNGANTYTGKTVINAGKLFVTPAHQATNSVTVTNGAAYGVQLTGGPATVTNAAITLASGSTTLSFGLGTNGNLAVPLIVCGPLTNNGTLNVVLAGNSSLLTVGSAIPLVKYSGSIAGAGSLNPTIAAPRGASLTLSNDVTGHILYAVVNAAGGGIVWTGTNSAPGLANLWDLNSTTNWLFGGSPTTYQETIPPGDVVTFNDLGSGTVLLSNTVSPASVTISNSAVNYTFQGTGSISGTTALTKQGSNTVTMSLANTFSGGVTLNSGTLTYGNATALGTGTATLAGGTLKNGNFNIANNISVSGSTIFDLAGGVGGGNSTWSGNISGSAALTLNNSGVASTLSLSGTNSGYGGTITFNNNSAVDFKSADAGSASAAWVFNDANAGRVRMSFGNATINFGSLAGSGQIVNNTASSTTILSVGALNTTTTFGGTIKDATGILALTKVGTGTLSVTGVNAYTGGTVIDAGTLAISSALTGSTATGVLTVNDGGTLLVSVSGSTNQLTPSSLTVGSSTGATLAFANVTNTALAPLNPTNLVINGTATINIHSLATMTVGTYLLVTNYTAGTVVLGALPPGVGAHLDTANNQISLVVDSITSLLWAVGNGSWDSTSFNWKTNGVAAHYADGALVIFDDTATGTGTILVTNTPSAVSPGSVTVNVTNKNYAIYGLAIAGNGALTKNGNGTLTLANTNTYSGGTTINGGTLQLSGFGTMGATNAGVTVSSGTVNLGGLSLTNGAVAISGGTITNGTLTGSSFSANNSSAATIAANLSGSGALTKLGNGTLTLTGTNTYSGQTTVGAGTLAFSGSGTNSIGNLMVTNNGQLSITAGTVNVNNTSGALTKIDGGATAVVSGGTLNINNGGGGWFPIGDTASMTGTFTVSGGTVNVVNAFGAQVARTGNGVLTITNNGSFIVNDSGALGLSLSEGGGVSEVNLDGGTLTMIRLRPIGGTETFRFNGGTLKPVASRTDFFPSSGVLTASVRNGGAIVDTAGFNVTIAQALVHSTVGGDNATDGGLTKLGTGTLTLSGANTYTGNTTINAGTLQLNQSVPVLNTNSTVSIASGAVLNLNNGAVTNIVNTLNTNGVAVANGLYHAGVDLAPFLAGTGYIQVEAPSVGPSGPGYITNSVSGGVLSLTWPAGQGWKLQVQTNSRSVGLKPQTNQWFDVVGSTSLSGTNITLDKTQPTIFYRLAYP